MSNVLITGSTGLVGSESVKFFCRKGFDVLGVDNNFRKFFFGKDGNTVWIKRRLKEKFRNYQHFDTDIRNLTKLEKLFKKHNWPILDVTRKSVEETAASIIKILDILNSK